jgi:hypothetical protein
MKNNRALPVFSVILYGLAAVFLLVAVSILLTTFGFNQPSSGSMSGLLEAYGPDEGMLVGTVKSVVGMLGVFFAILVLTVSALLFTAGQLLAHSNRLSQRLNALEAQLAALTHKP